MPNVILPSDPSTPTFTTTSEISAFSLSLTGNLTVNGSTAVTGTLTVGGEPVPSTNFDNQWTAAQRFKEPIAGGLFGDTMRRGRSDSRQRHRPVGFAAECDGLEDPRCTRTIGNASRLAPGLRGRAGDKLQGQASSVDVWHGSQSKRHLDIFQELPPLWHRKTEYQPSESRQKSTLFIGL